MNSKTRSKTTVVLAGIAIMISLAGCSTYKELVNDKNIAIERVDSPAARILHAGLYSTKSKSIILHGELKRKVYLRRRTPGHLDVELVNLSGKVFKEAEFNYYRRMSKKSRISMFSIPIPTELSLISAVRIVHHNARSHKSDSNKSAWRNVNTDT